MLFSDQLIGIVPPRHRLARRHSVSAATFAREPFVVREPESQTHSLVQRALAERGIAIQPILSLSSTEAVKRAVAAGLGVSIISKMAAGRDAHVVRIKDLALRRPIYAVRLRSHHETKPATALLCLLRHVAGGTLPRFKQRSAAPITR
jgi:DNA-binding transcriptional LysR family regulator